MDQYAQWTSHLDEREPLKTATQSKKAIHITMARKQTVRQEPKVGYYLQKHATLFYFLH